MSQEIKKVSVGGNPRACPFQGVLGAPSPCHSHDALVPLAEICGGLPAASPLLGGPGEVAGPPSEALCGAWVPGPGGLAQCPLPVPSEDRGASVSVAGVRDLGGGEHLVRYLICPSLPSERLAPLST